MFVWKVSLFKILQFFLLLMESFDFFIVHFLIFIIEVVGYVLSLLISSLSVFETLAYLDRCSTFMMSALSRYVTIYFSTEFHRNLFLELFHLVVGVFE